MTAGQPGPRTARLANKLHDEANEKAASQRLAARAASLTRGLRLRSLDTVYGLSAAPLAGVVVVVSVVVSVVVVLVPVVPPVPVVVVPLPASSPQPATTNAVIIINIANRLLIARSPEMNGKQILIPVLSG
jgi:hypothetical protein